MEPQIEPLSDPAAQPMRQAQAHLLSALQQLQGEEPHHPQAARAVQLVRDALGALAGETDAATKPAGLAGQKLANFAQDLRERRRAAKMSQQQLATAAGLSKRTIYNLETGAQPPSRATLLSLFAVAALKLKVSDELTSDPQWAPNSWFAPRYDPGRLMDDMRGLLASSGGQLEQTYLYLDPASALDYMQLCSSAPVYVGLRSLVPLEQATAHIARRFAGWPVDITGLGSGDGLSETRVAVALAAARSRAPDLSVYLLDISHTLLNVAYKHAFAQLRPLGVEVRALHGNFHDLPRYPFLHPGSASSRRRRLFTLLGGTVANLDNEVRFFQDLAHCCATDDLVLLDVQLVKAPANRPDEIRRLDAPLQPHYQPPHARWINGPVERHCIGVQSVRSEVELNTDCPVPGSYELDFYTIATMRDRTERRFLMVRGKRYDPDQLAACLSRLGFEELETFKYGSGGVKNAAVLLLRRK